MLTARGSVLDFDMGEEPDLVRGSGTRKSVPEPIWPHAGKVATQVKVFNEKLSPNRSNSETDLSREIEITSRTKIGPKKPTQISDLRRVSSHYQPTRDMSPIGECPSHDETEEERKLGNNDSIVTEALLRMTGSVFTFLNSWMRFRGIQTFSTNKNELISTNYLSAFKQEFPTINQTQQNSFYFIVCIIVLF